MPLKPFVMFPVETKHNKCGGFGAEQLRAKALGVEGSAGGREILSVWSCWCLVSVRDGPDTRSRQANGMQIGRDPTTRPSVYNTMIDEK